MLNNITEEDRKRGFTFDYDEDGNTVAIDIKTGEIVGHIFAGIPEEMMTPEEKARSEEHLRRWKAAREAEKENTDSGCRKK